MRYILISFLLFVPSFSDGSFNNLFEFNTENSEHFTPFQLSNIDFSFDENRGVLRYDVTIKNTSKRTLRSSYGASDYSQQGYQILIKPNNKLVSLTERNPNGKDMLVIGTGGTGFFNPNSEGIFRIEYKIKKGIELAQISKLALDATLVLLDGEEILTEIQLN